MIFNDEFVCNYCKEVIEVDGGSYVSGPVFTPDTHYHIECFEKLQDKK